MIKYPKYMKMTLKTARELKGLTQLEACKLVGITKDTLSNYERGKSYPDVPILRNIENAYGVRYDQLIFLPLDFGLTEKETKEKENQKEQNKEE